MPNIRSQTVAVSGGPQSLEIVATNGATFTLTKAAVQAFYQSTRGNAASRRAEVIAWCKDQIVAGLGEANVSLADLDYDIDLNSGAITRSTISGSGEAT